MSEKPVYSKIPSFSLNANSLKNQVVEANTVDGQVTFRGLVARKPIRFPADLGEEQPYDFSSTEGVYQNFGFVNAIVEKLVEYVWGSGFVVESENENAQAIIEQWIHDTDFDDIGRQWTREAIVKGNGYIELGGDKEEINGMKILDAKTMYISRTDKGVLKDYKQLTKGMLKDRDLTKQPLKANEDYIVFAPRQIACLQFNKIGSCAYGYGFVYPNLQVIDDYLGASKAMHTVLERKAGTPYDVTMGNLDKEIYPTPEAVDAMGQKMVYLQTKTEWVHGPDVTIKTLDFGAIADKFSFPLEHDKKMLFYGFQTPETTAGGGVSTGLGSNIGEQHGDAFQRHISAMQEAIEKVVEKQIFKRVLIANGLDVPVEIIWGQPSEEERRKKIVMLKDLLMSVSNQGLRAQIEKDLANTLGYGEEVLTDDAEREEEEGRSQPIVPGSQSFLGKILQKLGKKEPNHTTKKHEHAGCPVAYEDFQKDYTLMEWIGFNFRKYEKDIQAVISKDKFEALKALSEKELAEGYLSPKDVAKLKDALSETFKKGLSVKTLSSTLYTRKIIPDLYEVADNGSKTLLLAASTRAVMVARTEIIRMSALGAIKNYKDGGVEKVRYLAAMSDRTCPLCLEQDGQVYEIANIPEEGQVPRHPNCRCTYAPVILE